MKKDHFLYDMKNDVQTSSNVKNDKLNKRYKIMSYSACKKFCNQKHNKTSVIISITTYTGSLYEDIIITEQNNVKDILYLSFCDTEYEYNQEQCMQYEDGKKVADFVNRWYDVVDTIIVHCEGGISRSAGVCAAIMRIKEGTDYTIINSSKHPNMTCYIQTLKGFEYSLLKKD